MAQFAGEGVSYIPQEASRFVPLENLAINPQCGLTSAMEGNLLTEVQQWAKLQLAVTAPPSLVTFQAQPPSAIGRFAYNLSMKCGKCGHENLKAIEFCVRCHHPLRFTCPACKHEQPRGGQCDKCGADFAKYAAMLLSQAESRTRQAFEASKGRHSVLKQVLLAIFTFGLSLIFYHRSRAMDE